jgi:hypothetical protein
MSFPVTCNRRPSWPRQFAGHTIGGKVKAALTIRLALKGEKSAGGQLPRRRNPDDLHAGRSYPEYRASARSEFPGGIMKRIPIVAVLVLLATEALAISRFDPTAMPCKEVQETVRREGAVVLRYSSSSILGLPLYDRYVANHSFCGAGEVTRTTGVPSADQRYCPVRKCVASDIFVRD